MEQQHIDQFINTYGNLPSRVYKLNHDDSFQTLFKFLSEDSLEPNDILFAFDFDQTIKIYEKSEHGSKRISVRGGQDSIVGYFRFF